MKIPEAIAIAIDTRNAGMAGKIADQLRARCGMTYAQVLAAFQKVRPNLDAEEFESLMYDADEAEGDVR